MELFFELLIAALAVFGLWCLIHLLAETFLVSRRITLAVDLTAAVDLTETVDACPEVLLSQAARMLSCRRGQTVLLICTREWARENGAEALAERYGARLCVVESITQKAK